MLLPPGPHLLAAPLIRKRLLVAMLDKTGDQILSAAGPSRSLQHLVKENSYSCTDNHASVSTLVRECWNRLCSQFSDPMFATAAHRIGRAPYRS